MKIMLEPLFGPVSKNEFGLIESRFNWNGYQRVQGGELTISICVCDQHFESGSASVIRYVMKEKPELEPKPEAWEWPTNVNFQNGVQCIMCDALATHYGSKRFSIK
jgi:hypothetical protein